jgi:hypothetical protein
MARLFAVGLFIVVILIIAWGFALTGNMVVGGGSPQGSGVVSAEVTWADVSDKEMLLMDGEYFPIFQFAVVNDESCEGQHYHAARTVYSLTGEARTDPDPEGCGFGTVDGIPHETVTITKEEFGRFLNYSNS